jgi:hypothetical protein
MNQTWNARLGWALLLAGWAWAVVLDPWSLSEHDPDALVGSARMAARHAQAVVLAMGFLQIAVDLLLATPTLSALGRRLASGLTLLGSLVYAAGYVSLATVLPQAWLIPLGALLNLLGFATLASAVFWARAGIWPRAVVLVFCLGMTVDVAVGLFTTFPALTPSVLGPEDGVRQRMLRLARVAAVALSFLVLLFQEQAERTDRMPSARRGLLALVIGCVGMPTILVAASFVSVHVKYLLPIPALAAALGVLVALELACGQGAPLERWGWLLISISLNAGLVVGLYAFDGPLPAPPTQEVYNGFARRLARLAHAYCIVLGLLAILTARMRAAPSACRLLVVASCLTLAAVGLLALWPQAPWLLGGGPALVVVALAAAWWGARRDTFPPVVP